MSQNRLSNSTSPYLLQHKDNPVHWYPWGEEALATAKAENKPILLSVGYAACHWCHVMAHESFEDQQTAEIMNRLFVNIKVDREERPDIDHIYMKALHALGEQGGWPLTMFLTPNGEPFWGGTYFPKTAQWGRPSFTDLLQGVSRTYHEDRTRIDKNRQGLLKAITETVSPTAPIDQSLFLSAGNRLVTLFDTEHGGIKGAPKFPQASVMDLVWRTGLRSGDKKIKNTFLHTLRKISDGGIYDHLGGGISRYSVDHRWLVPHFEKMLYDNAQYLNQLAIAFRATGQEVFRQRIEETGDWILQEMQLPCGAFASSLDADSEGEEGKFYIWTDIEIIKILGEEDAAFFMKIYDVSPSGNWEGSTILNRLQTPDVSSRDEGRLYRLRQKLFKERQKRISPARDTKVLADWNALAVIGLVKASQAVSRESFFKVAKSAYSFIISHMMHNGRLEHAWAEGKLQHQGFASDHANMLCAALIMAETDIENQSTYIEDAKAFAEILINQYQADDGGFYMTAINSESLIVRPFNFADEATPNANSMAVEGLSRLYQFTGITKYREIADKTLIALSAEIPKNVFATASLLCAFDTRTNGRLAILIAPDKTDPNPFLKIIQDCVDPALSSLVLKDTGCLDTDHPAYGKKALDGKVTVYLCREGACSAPVNSRKGLQNLLARI